MTARPETCPDCSTVWAPTAGPLRNYLELGAYVWKCAECGRIVQNEDPSGRVVARR